MHYTSVNHAHQAIEQINQLRNRRELCDIILRCNETRIFAHKLVLSVNSPYFKGLMNTRYYMEPGLYEHPLKGIEGDAVQTIVNFFYTATVSVNEESVWTLLPAAAKLHVAEIQSLCSNFLLSILDIENCLKIHHIATECLASNLLKESTDFIKENFDKVNVFSYFILKSLSIYAYLYMNIYRIIIHYLYSIIGHKILIAQTTWDWIFKRLNTLSILASKPQLCNDILFFIPSFQFPPFSNLVNVNIWRPVFLLVFNGLFRWLFQLLDEDCFLDLEFNEAMPHLKRLGDTGLTNDQVLHAIKCWMVAAIDERQVFGLQVSIVWQPPVMGWLTLDTGWGVGDDLVVMIPVPSLILHLIGVCREKYGWREMVSCFLKTRRKFLADKYFQWVYAFGKDMNSE